RVATVISVGVATIAAAIGAGGLGTYIFRGLRMNDNRLILLGAVPAALMALTADWLLGLLESRMNMHSRRGKRQARSAIVRRITWAGALGVLLLCGAYVLWRGTGSSANGSLNQPRLVVGSKDFTEQVILGEILAQTLEAEGIEVERRFELGGNLCHDALVAGQIDCYPEYTGTSLTAILHEQPMSNAQAVYSEVKRRYGERFNIEVSSPLGFRNDFAILVRGADARRLGLRRISDATPHAPGWRAGFGQDFMSRPDGYAGFARTYDLKFAAPPREMDLSLTYRALASGEVDIIAGNSTDGLIAALDLVQLEDDRGHFPPYEAVVLFRRDLVQRAPTAQGTLERLGGKISTEEMRQLNYEVDGKKRSIPEVVREWRQSKGV
ncbi:MAG: glycine/betaine ABC transporter substrate-binding protein, partial [Pyrinomonadaceae bacterium]|nr:glycine/betaine ABC transporter substrate-binding protein [Pyrinomonadaceae bacterium]